MCEYSHAFKFILLKLSNRCFKSNILIQLSEVFLKFSSKNSCMSKIITKTTKMRSFSKQLLGEKKCTVKEKLLFTVNTFMQNKHLYYQSECNCS